ncbi:hypothetical protein ACEPPN_017789 [Leptodophora sp. 'Broadleaf-Isolate-01']
MAPTKVTNDVSMAPPPWIHPATQYVDAAAIFRTSSLSSRSQLLHLIFQIALDYHEISGTGERSGVFKDGELIRMGVTTSSKSVSAEDYGCSIDGKGPFFELTFYEAVKLTFKQPKSTRTRSGKASKPNSIALKPQSTSSKPRSQASGPRGQTGPTRPPRSSSTNVNQSMTATMSKTRTGNPTSGSSPLPSNALVLVRLRLPKGELKPDFLAMVRAATGSAGSSQVKTVTVACKVEDIQRELLRIMLKDIGKVSGGMKMGGYQVLVAVEGLGGNTDETGAPEAVSDNGDSPVKAEDNAEKGEVSKQQVYRTGENDADKLRMVFAIEFKVDGTDSSEHPVVKWSFPVPVQDFREILSGHWSSS